MSENYIGELLTVAFNFAPLGTLPCMGQLASIQQYTALFTLIGTTYGGDGQTSFGLPNLQSRVAIGFGQGPGLSPYVLGQIGGAETVTLLTTQMPAHTHGFTPTGTLNAVQTKATDQAPSAGALLARSVDGVTGSSSLPQVYVPAGTAGTTVALGGLNLAAGTTAPAGGSAPHANLQPYLAINYCIVTEGIFPSRN
ncbi:phage tail protein [Sphingomonas sp. PAMC 26605]|uniref:phage tail protein n=1 Tax=Sphingomonas sp. PAMC 26605 TaxID=1112214 RepID=UPI00026CDD38|nr:tail fiber protein [Sphingomonas sp. PAMC 26605]